jgi:hypothetical protein
MPSKREQIKVDRHHDRDDFLCIFCRESSK